MRKDLKGLRIRKSIWGRILSITLAGVLTVSSCYFAPARAIADDGETAVETAAPEEVQQPAEETPAAEPAAVEEPAASRRSYAKRDSFGIGGTRHCLRNDDYDDRAK